MSKKTLAALFLLGLLLAPLNAKAVTLGYVDFPPYEFQNKGKPDGALVLIVQTLFKRADIPLKLVPLPFKRAYEETRSGSIDGLFNFYKTKEREAHFDYSDPVIKNPLVFFVRKDSQLSYEDLDDLKGLKVGVMTGYTYGPDFDTSPLFTRDPSDSHESNLKKLVLGRLDAYPCDKLVGLYVAVRNDLMSELKILPKPLAVMNGYIGFTKGKHEQTIRKINAVLTEMGKNGEIEALIDSYIESSP